MSYVWKIVQEKTENHVTHATKAQHFFGLQVEDIRISDIFYKIHKFLRTSWASIITTTPINFLIAGHKYNLYKTPIATKLKL